ncbi:MAG: NAD(P)/FAD-dependent oxidoreductase [Promethearchaeota archaeon]|nr:MAG: NAD(P)/FAD-dependent oxidoreductase [Candidatus Lokiarchaeota archaeon]
MSGKFDVIVVGAGPAGAVAAYYLAKEFDRNILLVDKAVFPRDKPCGGYLTARVFHRFSFLKPDLSKMIEVPTYGSYFYSPDLMRLEWLKAEPVGYLAIRRKFDTYLKDLAVANGVEFRQETEVVDIEIKEDVAKILTKGGAKYAGDLIIGADGARSIIAKRVRIKENSKGTSKGLCVEKEIEVSEDFLERTYGTQRPTHYFYGFGNIIGYGWIFPKRRHLNVGIGGPAMHGKFLGRVFPKFIKFLQESSLLPESVENFKGFKAALIPTSTALYLKRSYSERVLLVGDALGIASSLSGEGIYQSMSSGEDAATIANEALSEGHGNSGILQRYDRLWKKDLGRELKTAGNIMQIGTTGDKADLIAKMNLFFRRMQQEKGLFEYFVNQFFGL